MSSKEKDYEIIQRALKGLIAKGLAKEEIINGQTHYSLTEAGMIYSKFGFEIAKQSVSDPKTRS